MSRVGPESPFGGADLAREPFPAGGRRRTWREPRLSSEDEHPVEIRRVGCEVTSVDDEQCSQHVRFILSWDGKRAMVCHDCAHVWIDRLTRAGKTLTLRGVNQALRV